MVWYLWCDIYACHEDSTISLAGCWLVCFGVAEQAIRHVFCVQPELAKVSSTYYTAKRTRDVQPAGRVRGLIPSIDVFFLTTYVWTMSFFSDNIRVDNEFFFCNVRVRSIHHNTDRWCISFLRSRHQRRCKTSRTWPCSCATAPRRPASWTPTENSWMLPCGSTSSAWRRCVAPCSFFFFFPVVWMYYK